METLSIIKEGELKRVDNSIIFILESTGKKIKIPIHKIRQIDLYVNITFSTELLYFLSKQGVGINFFHHYTNTFYGSFNMFNHKSSEKLLRIQLLNFEEYKMYYVSAVYLALQANMLYLLSKYQKRTTIGRDITQIMQKIRQVDLSNLNKDYLLREASLWTLFYSSIDLIITSQDFKFIKRSKRPPLNRINSLISFINMKLYNEINSSFKSTKLDQRFGFIHSLTDSSRMNLILDISEMFKPIMTYYFIFLLIGTNKLSSSLFLEDSFLLSKDGLHFLNKEFNLFLSTKTFHKKLNRVISYKYLFKLEGFKLIKSLYSDKPNYRGFLFKEDISCLSS